MIERGHVHRLYPASVFDRDDGAQVILEICNSQPATPENPTPCVLQRQTVWRDGALAEIKYRVSGVWFHPLDLLRTIPFGVVLCPECDGGDMFEPCERCAGVGVVAEGGGQIEKPNLRVAKA